MFNLIIDTGTVQVDTVQLYRQYYWYSNTISISSTGISTRTITMVVHQKNAIRLLSHRFFYVPFRGALRLVCVSAPVWLMFSASWPRSREI